MKVVIDVIFGQLSKFLKSGEEMVEIKFSETTFCGPVKRLENAANESEDMTITSTGYDNREPGTGLFSYARKSVTLLEI